jgi:DNA-binding transcriptional MerR regulator
MPKELFLLREAAKRIGVRPHQLDYAILSGFIPQPALRLGTMRVFTESDVKNAKRHFASKQKTKKEAHE